MGGISSAARLVMAGVGINLVLAVIKIASGILGSSYALVADGVESSLDVLSSLVVLGGLKVASLPPDENHPYGHGKAESLAGMLVAVFLICAAIGIALESIKEILVPHHAPAPFTLVVLLGVIVVKWLLSKALHQAGAESRSTSVSADAWHHLSDAITSAAAFVGISIALIGGEGYESADDWAALFASCIIVLNGIQIMRHALGEVMDETPRSGIEREVENMAGGVAGVRAIEQCRVRKSGLYYLVDIHVEVDGTISVTAGHDIARAVRNTLCKTSLGIRDVLVHIEPHAATRGADPAV